MLACIDLRDAARAELPILPDLPHFYASAVPTWRGRMVNEHGSARVFEGLAPQLRAAGFGDDAAATCFGFAAEERRHGVLCGAVVEALGEDAIFEPLPAASFPEHADANPVEAVLRNLLSVSCLSETVAVSLIGAELEELPEGELRALLRSILADEVGHARFGWRLVDTAARTLDARARARLGAYLAVAFGHLERHELAHLPAEASPPAEAAALGLCSGSDARGLFYDTVREVIVPRLEELDLPAQRAWERRVRGMRC